MERNFGDKAAMSFTSLKPSAGDCHVGYTAVGQPQPHRLTVLKRRLVLQMLRERSVVVGFER